MSQNDLTHVTTLSMVFTKLRALGYLQGIPFGSVLENQRGFTKPVALPSPGILENVSLGCLREIATLTK